MAEFEDREPRKLLAAVLPPEGAATAPPQAQNSSRGPYIPSGHDDDRTASIYDCEGVWDKIRYLKAISDAQGEALADTDPNSFINSGSSISMRNMQRKIREAANAACPPKKK